MVWKFFAKVHYARRHRHHHNYCMGLQHFEAESTPIWLAFFANVRGRGKIVISQKAQMRRLPCKWVAAIFNWPIHLYVTLHCFNLSLRQWLLQQSI